MEYAQWQADTLNQCPCDESVEVSLYLKYDMEIYCETLFLPSRIQS